MNEVVDKYKHLPKLQVAFATLGIIYFIIAIYFLVLQVKNLKNN